MDQDTLFSSRKLLVGITGSLGILALPSTLVAFAEIFQEVRLVMTKAACSFIPASTLRYLCKNVYTDDEHDLSHVELARWADLFMVLPTTANTFAETAYGLAPNLLTQTILCYQKGVIFFPNMNQMMWQQPAVQRNIQTLFQDGHHVYMPELVDCFEQASQSIRKNIVMPNLQEILNFTAACTNEISCAHRSPGVCKN